MTRCQSLRCPSLILWLDSHEAHGTSGHVATQQGQVWGACLLVVDAYPPQVPRPLGAHQCHAVLVSASVQLFVRHRAVLDVH